MSRPSTVRCAIPGTRWQPHKGASLRELMERMGHSSTYSSTRAALIYLHATRERDQAIAAGMGKLLKDAKKGTRPEARLLKIAS
jgi:hypothetical protein